MQYFPIFLMFYEFVAYMSNDMYSPAFPMIASYYEVSSDMIQLTLSAWLIGDAISQLILGPLADVYGKRTVLFAGCFLFIISCIGCAKADSIYIFIIYRFFQGIGVCSMMIAGYSSIHTHYKGNDLTNILSIMSGVAVTSPMIGPFIGGFLITKYKWQIIFWIISGMALFALIGLYFVMPKEKIQSDIKFNINTITGEYISLLKNGKFISNSLTFGLLYSGLMIWISTSPFILMVEYSLSPEEFGLVQIPIFVAFILGSQIVRFRPNKISIEKLVIYAISISIASSLMLIATRNVMGIIISMMIYGIGFGMSSAPLNQMSFNSSNSAKGVTAAIFYTSMMTTGAIITMIFGVIYNGHIISFGIAMVTISIAAMWIYLHGRNNALPA